MSIHQESSLIHWNYFLALESDLAQLARYIEFSEANFKSYSIEIAHLLLAASSEVDVLAKQICHFINGKTASNIKAYREIIKPQFPEIENLVVEISRYGLTLRPWDNWKNDETPYWWTAHNNVKHHRNEHFADANLKHLLNAISGLFIFNLYYYKHIIGIDRLRALPQFLKAPQVAKELATYGDGTYLVFNP